MKSFIIIYLFSISTINLIVNAHQNHDHKIYSWSNSKNKTIKTNTNVNIEKLEDKIKYPKTNYKINWTKFFRR